MNKYRKAISAGLTATLLASLFTMIAASTVLAGTAVTSAGSVPRGGTSTGTVTITLTENSATCLAENVDPAASTISIYDIDDVAPASEVTWSGTPVVSAPGSLDATATIAANVLTVDTDDSSDAVQEQIVITGLTITAAAGAEPGAIVALLVDNTAGDGGAANGGPNCWTATTRTATGTISIGIAASSTTVLVNVTGNCSFVLSAGTPSGLIFATLPETLEITAAPAIGVAPAGPGQQSLTIDATANNHQLGEAVSQTGVPTGATCPATLSSPGTVVDALNQNATSVQVFPGENNQLAGTTTVSEVNTGFLAAGTVVTFTLTDGILFSGGAFSPSLTAAGAGFTLTSGTCAVSVDRKSCTATVNTAATPAPALGSILLSAVRIDVGAAVPAGTAVKAVVTTSPTKAVNVTSNTIAIVSRIVVGVAAQPQIFFNENDQASGQLTLTETGAGFFTAGPGPTNVFAICLTSGESFTRAPWAVVTAGDLKLFSGLVGAAQSKGTLYNGNTCARWSAFSASTAASTIEIRGTDAADVVLPSGSLNGPRYNVGPAGVGFAPGPTLVSVLIGSLADVTAIPPVGLTTQVSNAIRAFRNQPVVAAVNQVLLVAGTTNGVMGNITITETQAGQFKANDTCFITILPQSQPAGVAQVVTFVGGVTSNVPLVTTNVGSGLLVGAVTSFTADDADFGFTITQQAVGTLGVITISNMHVSVLGDALPTIVQVRVDCNPTGGGVDINQVVSPARVGSTNILGIAHTRLGVTQVGSFSVSTKIPAVGKYVTYRLDFGVGAAGQLVQIWGATKTGNDWSAFTVVTTRRANASGVVYYYIRHNSATWRSYRGFWAGGGAWTPARQARWLNQ